MSFGHTTYLLKYSVTQNADAVLMPSDKMTSANLELLAKYI